MSDFYIQNANGGMDLLSDVLPNVTIGSEISGIDSPTGNPVVGQAVIAVTGTAVRLSATSVPLPGGSVFLTALSATTSMTAGGSAVSNAIDGTGNGIIVGVGNNVIVFTDDLNKVYVNGTAGDIISWSAG